MILIQEISPMLFLVLVLATYRLTRILTTDVIFEGLREKIWKKFPPSTKFGYLFTCNWCMSIWAAIILIVLFLTVPLIAYVVSLVLSISAIVGVVASRLD
jgi:hypothetical protein